MGYQGDYVQQTGMAVNPSPNKTNARLLGHPDIMFGPRRPNETSELVVSDYVVSQNNCTFSP